MGHLYISRGNSKPDAPPPRSWNLRGSEDPHPIKIAAIAANFHPPMTAVSKNELSGYIVISAGNAD